MYMYMLTCTRFTYTSIKIYVLQLLDASEDLKIVTDKNIEQLNVA